MSHAPLECRVTKTNIAHTRELSDTDLMTSLKTTSVSNYALVENKRGNKADSRKHMGDKGDTREEDWDVQTKSYTNGIQSSLNGRSSSLERTERK